MAAKTVNIKDLPLGTLLSLREETETHLKTLQAQFEALSVAKSRFGTSRECMEKLYESGQGTKMLVPLTDSLYQEGELDDSSRFIIDVGGGFYLERSRAECSKYFEKRIKSIDQRLQEVFKLLNDKKQILAITKSHLETRMQQQQQATN